ncbi:Hypothetical_protein [Hexamita inflata]|uniref:Hypothetical_protein n=1 Tax=Hexamita inflata TaxID=28002 RepID=A0AA86NBK8_9EUKA|nr:Hypothetical protein HINF_LOCUS4075 [Hexamita inflata]
MNKFDIKKQLLATLRRSVFLTYSNKLQLPSVLVLQSMKRGLRNMWQPNQETSLPRIETDILVLYPYKLDSSTSTLFIVVQILTQPKFVTEYKSLQALNFVIHHYQNGLNQIQEVLFSRLGSALIVVRTNHQLEIMYSESSSASLHTSILFYILAQMN